MNRPTLPAGIIPLGATHFYFDPARRTPAANPWRRLDPDGSWHMLRGSEWNPIVGTSRHKFFAIVDALRLPPSDLASESLTLRDELAKTAPITYEQALAIWGNKSVNVHDDATRKSFYTVWACLRYEFADVMLTAREAGK